MYVIILNITETMYVIALYIRDFLTSTNFSDVLCEELKRSLGMSLR